MASLPTPPAETSSSPSPPLSPPSQHDQPPDLSALPPFEMSFSLRLSCEDCVSAVREAVSSVPGILSAAPSLASQTLSTRGTAAPSAILAAIQRTGRDAVVRGTGAGGSGSGTGAAVAILEDYDTDDYSSSPVRGLARIVQISRGVPAGKADVVVGRGTMRALSVIDISLSGLSPGVYAASVRQTGDISRGSRSVGGSWRDVAGKLVVGKDGRGNAVVVGQGWEVWEAVGRAFAVERIGDDSDGVGGEDGSGGDSGTRMVVGVIARSAGVWDNDKMVCSCSGKTVWEERVEQRGRGML